jgi:hypothetical protein
MRKFTVFIAIITLATLSGCSSNPPSPPSATPTDTQIIATNTLRPTATKTPVSPTETPAPIKFLEGKISFIGAKQAPFSTELTIHDSDEFKTEWTVQSDENGEYYFVDIKPGKYNLWIMMTSNKYMISGCSDVISPGEDWETGIHLGATVLTINNNLSLLEAINQTDGRIDFISPEIELTSGNTVEFNIKLECK